MDSVAVGLHQLATSWSWDRLPVPGPPVCESPMGELLLHLTRTQRRHSYRCLAYPQAPQVTSIPSTERSGECLPQGPICNSLAASARDLSETAAQASDPERFSRDSNPGRDIAP